MIEVSIIITSFNDKLYLNRTLNSIYSQIEDPSKIEVIVADNGSTDGSVQSLESFKDVIIIVEKDNLKSPYSCRNRGIEIAQGKVIILLDSTCVPGSTWLKSGLQALANDNTDLVGGKVLFDFEGKLTAGKIYDSITNVRMKESIEIKKVAKAGNLFIKRNVFDVVGVFPEGLRSGGDVRWTHKVTQLGFHLVYSPDAIVYKPARTYLELLRKQWRVGVHQPLIWADNNKKVTIANRLKQIISPISPRGMKMLLNEQIKEQNMPEMKNYYYRLIFIGQSINMIMAIANIVGILRYRNQHD